MPAFPPKTNYAAGDVLTAAQMNDVGNALSAYQFTAGKNKIINGDFYWNQRAFTSTTVEGAYGFDRWALVANTGATYSAETFTPGTAPVAGYESRSFARLVTTGQTATNTYSFLAQRIEDVRTLANQTITVSFWAKANSGTPKVSVEMAQQFGSGGSPSSTVTFYGGQVTLGTTWQRYSVTFAVPTISGKTIGTTTPGFLALHLWVSAGSDFNSRTGSLGIQSNTFDFWGVQVEAGSTATPFTTATGTLAGELAACERYYQVVAAHTTGSNGIVNGCAYTGTAFYGTYNFRTEMRGTPTISATSGTNYYIVYGNNTFDIFDAIGGIAGQSTTSCYFYVNAGIALTQGYAYWIETYNASARVALQAEL